MDNENRENLRKSCKEPRIIKKSHKRSASQDMKPRPNSLQVNGYHHHHHHHSGLTTTALKPRITKLENLEARMASIEVSLSNALENSGSRLLTRTCKTASGTNNEDDPQLPTPAPVAPVENPDPANQNTNSINRPMADVLSSMVITNQQHHQQITRHHNQNLFRLSDQQLSKDAGQISEDCIRQNQNQIENKSALIKNLKLKLESLEVNDLDSRIYQAELECLLEKEEMNILNLHQEQISLRAAFNQIALNNNGINQSQQLSSSSSAVTMFSVVIGGHCTSVSAMEVTYDTQSPCFYVTAHHSGKGLIVQWAKETSKLKKGDRLLEVNGQLVIGCVKEDFAEILRQAVMGPLKMVVLRNTPMLPVRKVNSKEVENLKEEMSSVVNKLDTKIKENKELLLSVQKLQKDFDNLKDENQKLHHRTFYLEDQVSEMSRLTAQSGQAVKKLDTEGGSAMQAFIQQPESSVCASVTAVEGPKQTLTIRGATTLHFGTSAHQRKTLASAFQQTMTASSVKSHSVNQLDKLIVQRPTKASDHHILQVKIPFSSSEQNIGRTVSSYDVRTASVAATNTYINVPLPKTLSLQAPLTSFKTLNPSPTRWLHARQHGADSDSGNYSGDSMDDTQITGSPRMAAFMLHRQRQVPQEPSNENRIVIKKSPVETSGGPQGTSCGSRLNHCYVNVVEATGQHATKRLTVQNCVQVAPESTHNKQLVSSTVGHQASGQECTTAIRYVNQCQPQQQVVKASDGQRNLSNLKLKVNGNKIGLNDHESDNEEWC